jgi:hypothetical protein
MSWSSQAITSQLASQPRNSLDISDNINPKIKARTELFPFVTVFRMYQVQQERVETCRILKKRSDERKRKRFSVKGRLYSVHAYRFYPS